MFNNKKIFAVLFSIVCGVVVAVLRGYDWMYLLFCISLRVLYSIIGIIDYEKHIIPNRQLLTLFAIKSLWLVSARCCELLKNSLLGLALMILIGLVVYVVGLSAKHDETIGFGDYKYLIILGYCCGINKLFCVFLCSLIVVIFVLLITKMFDIKDRIALAPYMSIGAILFG